MEMSSIYSKYLIMVHGRTIRWKCFQSMEFIKTIKNALYLVKAFDLIPKFKEASKNF